MRYLEIILESEIIFQDENRNFHHGQSDQTLNAYVGGKRVGYIEYSVYQGEPHVQMIEVFQKRKGYGSALVRKLQSMFPDVEIDMGLSTDDGSGLLGAMPQTVIHDPVYQDKAKRLAALQAKEADYMARSDAGEPLDGMSDWNDIHDEMWNLEQDLRDLKPSKRIFQFS